MRELERRFPPEFRNRIDEVVLFAPLTHDEVREIARHYLDQVKMTLLKAGKTIQVTDEALELVVVKGYSMAFGARFLKRFIDEQIKLPISAQWKDGTHFDVSRERRRTRGRTRGREDANGGRDARLRRRRIETTYERRNRGNCRDDNSACSAILR